MWNLFLDFIDITSSSGVDGGNCSCRDVGTQFLLYFAKDSLSSDFPIPRFSCQMCDGRSLIVHLLFMQFELIFIYLQIFHQLLQLITIFTFIFPLARLLQYWISNVVGNPTVIFASNNSTKFEIREFNIMIPECSDQSLIIYLRYPASPQYSPLEDYHINQFLLTTTIMKLFDSNIIKITLTMNF